MRGFIIKLMVGLAGLAILVRYGSIDLAVLLQAADRPDLLAAAFLCLLASVPIAAVRWWMLLKGLQFGFSLPWSMNITFISLFFHTFLPGAHGGDLVRLALAYKASGSGLNRLTFSVLVDRLCGLFALVLLGVAMIPALPDVYAARLGWIAVIVLVVCIAGTALAIVCGSALVRLLSRLPAPVGLTLAHIVGELLAALRAYVAQPSLLAGATAISILQYGLILAALIVLGEAMHFKGLSLSGYIVAGVWSLVANSLPITPGGIGVGEAAFAHAALVLATAPSPDGAGFGTVFLAMRVLTVLLGLGGLLPWILHRMDLRSGLMAIKTKSVSDRHAVPLTK